MPGTNFMSLLCFFFAAVCVPCFLGSFVQKLFGVSLDSAKCRLMIKIHSLKDR